MTSIRGRVEMMKHNIYSRAGVANKGVTPHLTVRQELELIRLFQDFDGDPGRILDYAAAHWRNWESSDYPGLAECSYFTICRIALTEEYEVLDLFEERLLNLIKEIKSRPKTTAHETEVAKAVELTTLHTVLEDYREINKDEGEK